MSNGGDAVDDDSTPAPTVGLVRVIGNKFFSAQVRTCSKDFSQSTGPSIAEGFALDVAAAVVLLLDVVCGGDMERSVPLEAGSGAFGRCADDAVDIIDFYVVCTNQQGTKGRWKVSPETKRSFDSVAVGIDFA
jgi:hypothetical protein